VGEADRRGAAVYDLAPELAEIGRDIAGQLEAKLDGR